MYDKDLNYGNVRVALEVSVEEDPDAYSDQLADAIDKSLTNTASLIPEGSEGINWIVEPIPRNATVSVPGGEITITRTKPGSAVISGGMYTGKNQYVQGVADALESALLAAFATGKFTEEDLQEIVDTVTSSLKYT